MTHLQPKETDIIRLISDWLSWQKIVHWRLNSGAVTDLYKNKYGYVKKRIVRFIRLLFPKDEGLKFPDLMLIFNGITAYVEVKRQGRHRDDPGQDRFLRMIIDEGGYGAKINCLEDIQDIIQDIRDNHNSTNKHFKFNGHGL